MVADGIKGIYHQTKWALIFRGLFSLAIGCLILARPIASVAALALVIALWSLSDGIINMVRSFQIRAIAPHWWVMALGGLISIAFGIAALYYFPGLSLSFAVLWTAYWLTLSGVVAAYLGFQERSAGLPWGWTVALGVLSIAAGVLAFVFPGATLATLIGVIAGFAILSGIAMLMGASKMQALGSEMSRAFNNAARV